MTSLPFDFVSSLVPIGGKLYALGFSFNPDPEVIYVSPDNGDSWLPASSGLNAQPFQISRMISMGNSLFCVKMDVSDEIYMYNGSSWSKVAMNGLPLTVKISMITEVNGNRLYIVTDDGLYQSSDRGAHWGKVASNGLYTGLTIQALAFAGDDIFAGTNGGSIWKAVNPALGAPVVNAARALQVYPNPANSTATLSYEFTSKEPVQIEVTDMTGRTVISASRQYRSGKQQEVMDTGSLKPGIYIIRLTAGNEVSNVKLSVTR
jgi:hypothetical protein